MSLWKRLWPRKVAAPESPKDEPRINEDWKPGDLALCIAPFNGWLFAVPIEGDVYVVKDIRFGPFYGLDDNGNWFAGEKRGWSLELHGHVFAGKAWADEHFKKIERRKDEETADIGISEMIRCVNPAPVGGD